MPKINGTRKQRAAELFERLKRGPVFYGIGPIHDDPKDIYKRWSETWILQDVRDLIPELKDRRK